MKLTLVTLVSALATTAFAWPKADIVFANGAGKTASQSLDADGNPHNIVNNLVVAKITSKSSVACTYTAADGSKTYTRNFQTVAVKKPQKLKTVSCLIG